MTHPPSPPASVDGDLLAPADPIERDRMSALRRHELLDTPRERAFDDIVAIAARLCAADYASISLVDSDRLWFKAIYGMDAEQIPRRGSLCAEAVRTRQLLMVADASKDPRFRESGVVCHAPHIRFYAGAPLITAAGHALGTLCVFDSNPRTIDAEARETLEALARQVVSLIELRQRLREQERVERIKDEFITVVSHELRTPLTSIRGSLGLIQGEALAPLDPDLRELVDVALRNTDRLKELVDGILDLDRLVAAQAPVADELVDPGQIVAAALDALAGTAAQRSCALILQPPAEQLRGQLFGDAARLVQVLSNLIANAVKFSPPGGSVTVSFEPAPGRMVRFLVRDRGPGIAPTDQERIFARFTRLDETNAAPGTGLGLAIVKEVVRQHKGQVGVESALGEGSTFYVELPTRPIVPEVAEA